MWKADWTKYTVELRKPVNRLESEFKGGIIELEIELCKAINRAFNETILRVRGGIRTNRWWNKELEEMKKIEVQLKAK